MKQELDYLETRYSKEDPLEELTQKKAEKKPLIVNQSVEV
jgi:hypothetical protein